jgi:hypothetical protein
MPLTITVASQRSPYGHSAPGRRHPAADPALGHAEPADTGSPEASVFILVAVVRTELTAELSRIIFASQSRWIVDEDGVAILVGRCGLFAEIRVQAESAGPKNRSALSSRGSPAKYTWLKAVRGDVR